MKTTVRFLLTSVLGAAALLAPAGAAAAAPGQIEAPPVSASDLTSYASFKEAPVYTATAPGTELRTEDTYTISEVVYENGDDIMFRITEPFTADDGSEWRAVDRFWMNGGGGMDFEPMFVPAESIKEVLTADAYEQTLATEAPAPEASPSQGTTAGNGPQAPAATEAPEAPEAQDAEEESQGAAPMILWIAGSALILAGGAAFLAKRRKASAQPGPDTEQ